MNLYFEESLIEMQGQTPAAQQAIQESMSKLLSTKLKTIWLRVQINDASGRELDETPEDAIKLVARGIYNKCPGCWLVEVTHDKSPATVHVLEQAWRDPVQADLDDPLFEAIWQVIRTWDVNVPEQYVGYCGANGNHAVAILDAVKSAQAQRIATLEQAVGELVSGLRRLVEHVGLYTDADYPQRSHEGFCGPEAGCDAICMEIANMADRDAAVRHAATLIQKHGGLV